MENPRIECKNNPNKKCLKFIFNDKLNEQDAVSAIERWRKSFKSYPGEKIVLIWDCLNMKGYKSGVRNHCQSALKEMKGQIGSIWLITNSGFIRMGASVMSVFASYPIKVVNSENDIVLKKLAT